MLFNRKGQSTAEYAIILGVVVGAIMAIGVFLRGGIEGKVRHMTNEYLGQGGDPTSFETAVMSSDYVTSSTSLSRQQQVGATTQTEVMVGGFTEEQAAINGTTTRTGSTTYFE